MKLKIQDPDIVKVLNFLRIKNKSFHKFVAAVEKYFNRLAEHHSFLIAAGIAFNLLMYLIPLLLVAIYVVNLLFGVESVSEFIMSTLKDILPPNQMTGNLLETTMKEIYIILETSSIAGIIGIVTLLWLSSILFSSLRSGLNDIFRIKEKQVFIIYRLRDMLMTIVLTFLILISSYAFPIMAVIVEYLKDYLAEDLQSVFSTLYLRAFSLLSSFILFYFMFRFIPTRKTDRAIRLLSTVLCVVLIEISRYIFAWYISGISAYSKFYGTYAILASMALWIYYLTLIILLSAEFSQLLHDLRRGNGKENIIEA